jgi:hypothetical protein
MALGGESAEQVIQKLRDERARLLNTSPPSNG